MAEAKKPQQAQKKVSNGDVEVHFIKMESNKECPALDVIEKRLSSRMDELREMLDYEINPIKVIEIKAKISEVEFLMGYLKQFRLKDGPERKLIQAIFGK